MRSSALVLLLSATLIGGLASPMVRSGGGDGGLVGRGAAPDGDDRPRRGAPPVRCMRQHRGQPERWRRHQQVSSAPGGIAGTAGHTGAAPLPAAMGPVAWAGGRRAARDRRGRRPRGPAATRAAAPPAASSAPAGPAGCTWERRRRARPEVATSASTRAGPIRSWTSSARPTSGRARPRRRCRRCCGIPQRDQLELAPHRYRRPGVRAEVIGDAGFARVRRASSLNGSAARYWQPPGRRRPA